MTERESELREERSSSDHFVSIVIPCRNESATIGQVVREAEAALAACGYRGEVVVVDNGSTDSSIQTATEAGARVVRQVVRGYGAACLRGVEESRGSIIVFVDGDGTYDLSVLHRFVEPVRAGYGLVLGTRRNGEILPGAMRAAHRHVLEPMQNFLLRSNFGLRISDVRCGMRAVARETVERLSLGASGMEFAGEMLIEAARADVPIVEVPVEFRPRAATDSRRTLEDGWRVVRRILILSPTRLYLVPGLALLLMGLVLQAALLPGPIRFRHITLDYHFLFVGSAVAILGLQLVLLGIYAKTYGLIHHHLSDRWIERFHQRYTLERGVAVGGIVFIAGLAINVYILSGWIVSGAGMLFAVRPAVVALTLMVVGVEIIFASFFLSLLRASEFGRS
ncbi:MAG TPA: glycosyltransferase family 2 protein [Thermoanaerobaculia bacterium]|nr:glycosyltransferase family 2 protein [Thermoanaerobaculia bacterium]